MTSQQTLTQALTGVVANTDYSEAVLRLADGSRLCFCHRVDERWAKALGPERREDQGGVSGQLLAEIVMFRLNAKHLDIQFEDGSRWDQQLQKFSDPGD